MRNCKYIIVDNVIYCEIDLITQEVESILASRYEIDELLKNSKFFIELNHIFSKDAAKETTIDISCSIAKVVSLNMIKKGVLIGIVSYPNIEKTASLYNELKAGVKYVDVRFYDWRFIGFDIKDSTIHTHSSSDLDGRNTFSTADILSMNGGIESECELVLSGKNVGHLIIGNDSKKLTVKYEANGYWIAAWPEEVRSTIPMKIADAIGISMGCSSVLSTIDYIFKKINEYYSDGVAHEIIDFSNAIKEMKYLVKRIGDIFE